jgi:hypothetical protein
MAAKTHCAVRRMMERRRVKSMFVVGGRCAWCYSEIRVDSAVNCVENVD